MRNLLNRATRFRLSLYRRWLLLFLFALTLPWTIQLIPFYGPNDYTYSQLNTWLIFSLVAVGLNLLTGLAGMISLGHSAIFAIGAFTTGYLVGKIQLPFLWALLLTALLSGAVGLLLGLPALRLSGPYLAIATFAFAAAIPQLLFSDQINALLGDSNATTSSPGVFSIPKQSLPSLDVRSDLGRYYLFLLLTTLMLVFAKNLWQSYIGQVWQAIREDEIAAQAVGLNVARYKILAFGFSAVFAGVGGSMYAAQLGQLDAHNQDFNALQSIVFLTAIVVGGLGSIAGAFVGVAVLTILPNFISALNQLWADVFGYKISNFETIFYGMLIISGIFYLPEGVVGLVKKLLKRKK